MRLLDIELKRAIQDMPNEAITELKDMIKKERLSAKTQFATSLRSDELRDITNAVRQRYGLEDTVEFDDERAVEDIKNPEEKARVMAEINAKPDKTAPVRMISVNGMDSVLNKEIRMRKEEKYAETLEGASIERISELIDEVNETYCGFGIKKDRRYEIDPEYGINFFDKIDALHHVEGVLAFKNALAKCSPEEFMQKKNQIENMDRFDNVSYASYLYGEVTFAAEILGVNSYDAQEQMTMADIAEVIEAKEKELYAEKGVSIHTMLENAIQAKPTRESVKETQRNATLLRGLFKGKEEVK